MRRGLTITAAILLTTVALYAAASYPSGVKSFSTKLAGQTISAAHVNDIQDELVAVEDGLLNGVAHALKPSVASAQDLGTSALPWGKARVGGVQLTDATTLTLASDAVTATQSYHALETEGAAAADNLATITAGAGIGGGFVLVLRAANVAHVVTLQDGTGNLLLNGNCALGTTDATITLIYDGTNWREIARSNATGSTTLIHAASGTDAAAGATTVDSCVLPALSALDTIRVEYYMESVTQTTATPGLYSSTDAASILLVGQAGAQNVTAGTGFTGRITLKQRQGNASSYVASSVGAGIGISNPINAGFYPATAVWSAAWTLGLRHGGVTAGGTFKYSWAVYLEKGQ